MTKIFKVMSLFVALAIGAQAAHATDCCKSDEKCCKPDSPCCK